MRTSSNQYIRIIKILLWKTQYILLRLYGRRTVAWKVVFSIKLFYSRFVSINIHDSTILLQDSDCLCAAALFQFSHARRRRTVYRMYGANKKKKIKMQNTNEMFQCIACERTISSINICIWSLSSFLYTSCGSRFWRRRVYRHRQALGKITHPFNVQTSNSTRQQSAKYFLYSFDKRHNAQFHTHSNSHRWNVIMASLVKTAYSE